MTSCKLIVFKHDHALGSAPAGQPFDRVNIGRNVGGEFRDVDERGIDNYLPARKFTDYIIAINHENPPAGIEIIEKL